MSITISQSFDALTDVVKNISNVSTDQKLRAANFINELFYKRWYGVDPEQFLETYTFKTALNERSFSLPSDFLTFEGGGLYRTSSGGSDLGYIPYDGGSTIHAVGETLTADTGATALIEEVNGDATSGILIVSKVDTSSGEFTDDAVLTDGSGGASVQNGSIELFSETQKQWGVSGHGASGENYRRKGSNLIFSQFVSSAGILQLQFIPTLEKFTKSDLSEEYIVEDRHEEHIRDALLIWHGIFDKDQNAEVVADARFAGVLADFEANISATGEVWNEQDTDIDFA